MREVVSYRCCLPFIAAVLLALLLFPHGNGSAQEQVKNQQKCINALNKGLAQVAKAQGKNILSCMKDGAKKKLGSLIEDCLTADRKGKVAKAMEKTIAKAQAECLAIPDFGATTADAVNDVAVAKELSLIHNILGSDLHTAIITQDKDKPAAKCQHAVTKAVMNCENTKLKVFNACKKKGLKENSITTAVQLEACLQEDPKGKIAKACAPTSGKIALTVNKKCVEKDVDLSATFPAPLDTGDGFGFAASLERVVECHVCLALNAADDLTANCDLFDNGVADGSCGVSSSCEIDGDGAPCDDGVFCNGADTCNAGACSVHPGDPCNGPNGNSNCLESCSEATASCNAPDPDGSPCSDINACTVGETCMAGICGGGVELDCKRAFVTSTLHRGDFGSVSAGDAICESRALAGGLPGTFLAWLSDATTSPAGRFTLATAPYITTRPNADCSGPAADDSCDLRVIADDWNDLTDGGSPVQITYNEFAQSESSGITLSWTGTLGDGTPGSFNCLNWTRATASGIGGSYAAGLDDHWTFAQIYSCASNFHLYCFEQ